MFLIYISIKVFSKSVDINNKYSEKCRRIVCFAHRSHRMSDFSIKAKNVDIQGKSSISKGSYSSLKKEYDCAMKKMSQSDFANSPAAMEKELTLLAKLKVEAGKEGLEDELKQIESRQQAIYTKLANNKRSDISNVYYKPISFGCSQCNPMIDPALNDKFKSHGYTESDINYVLKKCTDIDGNICSDKTEAVDMFLDAGMSSAIIPQLLEEFEISEEESDSTIDLYACQTVCDYKLNGFDDYAALKYTKFLQNGFDDEQIVMNAAMKMKKSGISSDNGLKLLDILKTKNPETGLFDVDRGAVQSLTRVKTILSSTKENENKERNNPINKLGVQTLKAGNTLIIIKDNKIVKVTDANESILDLQTAYDELISGIEDELLCDFAGKYKNEEGGINTIYPRTLIALRRAGITYPMLMEMTQRCVDENGVVNKNEISNVSVLKEAGVLSEDIPVILDACNKKEDGTYDELDINNAVSLTGLLIRGDGIAKLLPSVKNNENMKDFISFFAQLVDKDEDIVNLVSIVENGDGKVDENAIDVIYSLAEKGLDNKDSLNMEEFISQAKDLVSVCKNKNEDVISDDAAGIVSIMLKHSKTIDNIKAIIEDCRDDDGKIDEQLAEIVWDANLQDADMIQIMQLIDICKPSQSVDFYIANTIIKCFDMGLPVDKIIDSM